MSTSIFGGVHLRQIRSYMFPFGRAVRSSQTRKRGETAKRFFFLFLDDIPGTRYCFSRAALNLFVSPNQSAPIHAANGIPFGSFQCSLGGIKTRPQTNKAGISVNLRNKAQQRRNKEKARNENVKLLKKNHGRRHTAVTAVGVMVINDGNRLPSYQVAHRYNKLYGLQ